MGRESHADNLSDRLRRQSTPSQRSESGPVHAPVKSWPCHANAFIPIPWRSIFPPFGAGVRGDGPACQNEASEKKAENADGRSPGWYGTPLTPSERGGRLGRNSTTKRSPRRRSGRLGQGQLFTGLAPPCRLAVCSPCQFAACWSRGDTILNSDPVLRYGVPGTQIIERLRLEIASFRTRRVLKYES